MSEDYIAADLLFSPTPPPAAPETVLMFLHVQKAAGSSLRNSLTACYAPETLALLYPSHLGMSVGEFLALPPARRGAFRLIMGHFFFGLHNVIPAPVRYIAFLRAPLARIRSHIQQHLRFNTRFFHDGRDIDIVTVVNEGLSEEFDNLQLRLLAGTATDVVPLGGIGEAHMRLAMANLLTRFGFVGLMEEIGRDWPRLLAYLGLPAMALQRDNVSPAMQADAKTIFASIDWDRVAARHVYDIALYRFVQSSLASGDKTK
jgi:hypothetical protein